jgi:hypothetical protein
VAVDEARDLQRDPLFALHSQVSRPPGWKGDQALRSRRGITDPERIAAVYGDGCARQVTSSAPTSPSWSW